MRPALLATLPPALLTREQWLTAQQEHAERAEHLLRDVAARAAAGEQHPVEDFLFTYYSYRPSRIRRWHPGIGVVLDDAVDAPQRQWAYYGDTAEGLAVDAGALLEQRQPLIEAVTRLLRATLDRAPSYRCFGMHEWAMVYHQDRRDVRHSAWPLRLGADGTDAVVDAQSLVCTHFDAFRFFTDDAAQRNATTLTRALQPAYDQAGCLHANMDLYKWAYKLSPATPGDLLLDCYELARDLRYLDMAASPYDFSGLGVRPVRVETAQGRAEYAAAQRTFADRARPLRERLLSVCLALGGAGRDADASRVRDCD